MASRASVYHKECIEPSAEKSGSACSSWKDLLSRGSAATGKEIDGFGTELYPENGPGLWFDISTDYQQNKKIPS